MLGLHIIAVGTLKEAHWTAACAEYQKRIGPLARLRLTEITEHRLPRDASPAQITAGLEREGEKLLERVPPRAYIVALCVEDRGLSSEQLAQNLENAAQSHPEAVFLIGSSHGLSESVKKRAHLRLSLSALTLPHQLARVVLFEQLYRAATISHGIKYHK